jgi:hypothetical protein
MTKKPQISLVTDRASTSIEPPRPLGIHGRSLWDRIMSEYDIRDAGGVELLTQACQALDRAEALREQIESDGEVIRVRGLVKAHPALRDELNARAFCTRTLQRLNLDMGAVKAVGRPGGIGGWGGLK